MKAAVVILLAFCLPGYCQLVLNPGDSWAYEFSNLPRTGSTPMFGSNPGGLFQFSVNSSTFQSGDVLRYDMFESTASEAPICSGTMIGAPFNGSCARDFSWQDRQGGIRFTLVSGPITVDSITVASILPGPSLSSYDVYSETFTPVPEPAVTSLVAA